MSYTVAFTDNSQPGPSGPITAWAWDFGDGGTSSSQNPTHAYAATGNYSVKLTVTGTGSDGIATITSPITVVDIGVLSSYFSYSVSSLAVTFTDLSVAGPSGPITGWAWNFGDTNTSTSQNPSHTYGAAGSYTVTLTVTGTSPDGTAVSSQSVTVTSASPNFVAASNTSRPAFTPARTVNFSTKAQLDAAIADMTAGDLIQYNGTGVLTISSASGPAYTLASKNPASTVVIDFGTAASIWNPAAVSHNYVKFAYTGTANKNAFGIKDCSKLRIYGGEISTGKTGGVGFLTNALTHDVLWYDGYVNVCGSSGLAVRGSNSLGAASNCYNLDYRFEVNRFAMNPAFDTHNDKGTGQHGCILHGSSGGIHDSTFTIYAHDPLQPGETSAGNTWPEGAGGSVIEQGNSPSGDYGNVTLYALGVNLLMVPDATNPGSTGGGQTGGNIINLWGVAKLNGNVVGWAEGRNTTGSIIHSDNGSWFPGSPPLTVQHGRHTNTNQSTAGGNISQAYPTTTPAGTPLGISYSDCT